MAQIGAIEHAGRTWDQRTIDSCLASSNPAFDCPYGDCVFYMGSNIVAAATIVKAATCAEQPGPGGPGRRGSIRSRGGELPADEKVGHCGGLHAAHGLEFAGPLTVKELAALAEDGEGRNPLAQRNPVALGDVEILVHVPDIDW